VVAVEEIQAVERGAPRNCTAEAEDEAEDDDNDDKYLLSVAEGWVLL
jgi:hypothetical protein